MLPVRIGVVGAGVVGLCTAVNVQQLLPHAWVTIIADNFSEETTSDGAGGLFRPTAEFIKGVPPDTIKQWTRDSAEYFMKIAASADAGKFGVFPMSGYHLLNREVNPEYKSLVYSFRQLTPEELQKLGTTYSNGYAITTLIVEPRKYMAFLMTEFRKNGGQSQKRTLHSLEELVGQFDVVVNCSGMRSRWLVNDPLVYPVRGQIIKINAPWIKSFIYTDDDAYIIPRGEDVVLGGVRHTNDFSTEIREQDKQGILDRCARLIPSVKAEIVKDWAGLRPHRDPVRLETENMKFKSGDLQVVHNYGHGGNGIALSWGVGVHASKLVKDYLAKSRPMSRL
ncbi:D-aspartate oxidase-like isoform X2 [Liolophura sinensis]|uniref:D-aspartate oxidase-like isoform X2 n=1 Tax=Liolophura sinensis TaxID=3198878 RepID=UPI003158C883